VSIPVRMGTLTSMISIPSFYHRTSPEALT
jgi:hypothetical protein